MHYIPNFLTLLRILLIPVIIIYFLDGKFTIAGLIFAFSVFTDFLDGYFARKYNLTSKLGRLMDPFADKLTVISILYILVLMEILPAFVAIILLSREIVILIGSITSYLMGIDLVNPSKLGKLSIFVLYIAIVTKMLKINYIDMILFYIVIPLNIYSAFDYISKFFNKSRQIN
ncbi:MAG: CDP-diacylglycerol--glycerol-3-phosphate 3-phosphatidyltransferase [bacterium]